VNLNVLDSGGIVVGGPYIFTITYTPTSTLNTACTATEGGVAVLMKADESFDFTYSVTDVNAGEVFSVAVSTSRASGAQNLANTVAPLPGNVVTFSPQNNDYADDWTVLLTFTDSNANGGTNGPLSCSFTFLLTVEAANFAPTIPSLIADLNASIGTLSSYIIPAPTDLNPLDTFAFGVLSSPAWSSFVVSNNGIGTFTLDVNPDASVAAGTY